VTDDIKKDVDTLKKWAANVDGRFRAWAWVVGVAIPVALAVAGYVITQNNSQMQDVATSVNSVASELKEHGKQSSETAILLSRTTAVVTALEARVQDVREEHDKDIQRVEQDVRDNRRSMHR